MLTKAPARSPLPDTPHRRGEHLPRARRRGARRTYDDPTRVRTDPSPAPIRDRLPGAAHRRVVRPAGPGGKEGGSC
jgi:hypothetical protein